MVFFDPRRPAYLQDPYPVLARLRREEPVHWNRDLHAWIPTRYAECSEILHDSRRFTSDPALTDGPRAEAITSYRASVPLGLMPHLGTTSGEAHRRLRRIVNPVFATAAMRTELGISGFVDEYLDRIPEGRPFDFMESFANLLPKRVMMRVIGFPPEQGEALQRALTAIEIVRSNPRPGSALLAEARAAETSAVEALGQFRNGALPSDTVLGALMPAESAEGCLAMPEVISMAAHIATVGSDPTTGALANSVAALANHPEALDRLRAEPELVRAAVHEFLRFDSPTHMVPRFAVADSELGGKRIRRGDTVLAMIGSANRDPAAFDHPDVLDLDRDARKQLGFGQGDHICLGAPLALVIMEAALNGLVNRFKRIEMIGPPLYGTAVQLRIPDRLVLRCE